MQFSPLDGDTEPSVVIHLAGYDEAGGATSTRTSSCGHEAEAVRVARELLDMVAVLGRTIGAAA